MTIFRLVLEYSQATALVFFSVVLLTFLSAAAVAWLLFHTRDFHIRWTGDHPHAGPQKLQSHATPRVGGLSIMFGLMAGLVCMHFVAFGSLQAQMQGFLAAWLIAGAVPLILLGLLEDMSSTVSVRLRLVTALAAGGLACAMGGARIIQLNLPLIDQLLLSVPAVSLLLTMVAVGGLVHAMNIVDGVNGLLAGMTILMLAAIALVAARVGEPVLMLVACIGLAATLGFGMLNFPQGRIFCGDGGPT